MNHDYGGDQRDIRGDRYMGGFKDDHGRRMGMDGDEWRHGGDFHGGMGGGARFMLRSGDTQLAVRCDGQESMRTCVETTITLMDKARSLATSSSATSSSTPSPTPAPAR